MNGKLSPKREAYNAIARALIYLCAGITVLLLVALIAYIFYRGLGNITWQLLSTQRSASRGPSAFCRTSFSPSTPSLPP